MHTQKDQGAVKCSWRFVLWLSGAQSSRGVNSPGCHPDMLAKCRFFFQKPLQMASQGRCFSNSLTSDPCMSVSQSLNCEFSYKFPFPSWIRKHVLYFTLGEIMWSAWHFFVNVIYIYCFVWSSLQHNLPMRKRDCLTQMQCDNSTLWELSGFCVA